MGAWRIGEEGTSLCQTLEMLFKCAFTLGFPAHLQLHSMLKLHHMILGYIYLNLINKHGITKPTIHLGRTKHQSHMLLG